MDQAQGLRELIGGGRRQRPLRILATASGKGGVGKTMLAANLALLSAKEGKRTLLLDADVGLANVEIALGIEPEYHLGHLLEGAIGLERILAKGPHGLQVLSAGSGMQRLTRLDEAQRLRLVTAIDGFEDRFDTVIIDAGAGIGDNVLFFVGAAQEALLLVSPEPTSLSDAYAAVKVLSQQAGVRWFNVVVNPAANAAAASEAFDRLVRVTNRFLDASLRLAGFIPPDPNVHRAVMARRPLVDAYPLSPASRAVNEVSLKLASWGAPPDVGGGLKFMWHRLFRESNRSMDD